MRLSLNLDGLPLDDPAVYRLLAEGDTIGCFQVESRAQSSMLPRLRPERFDDLIIEISIVGPGRSRVGWCIHTCAGDRGWSR